MSGKIIPLYPNTPVLEKIPDVGKQNMKKLNELIKKLNLSAPLEKNLIKKLKHDQLKYFLICYPGRSRNKNILPFS